MTWRKAPLLLLFLLAVLFWVSSMPSQAAEPVGPGGYFVRIPAGSALTAARLNLQPLIALDYGSFQWLELTAADYAKLSASSADFTLEADAGKVQVVTYTFDPLYEGEPKLDAAMQNNTQGEALRLVQFFGPTNDAWLADLDAAGLTPLQYYPHNAFLTWGTAAQLAALESSPFVRWQGVVHPAYKIDPALTGRSGLISNVDVMFYNDGRLDDTLDAIANLGGNVLQHYPSQPDKAFYNAVVQLDAAKVADVAQINTVLWMGYLSPAPILDDEMSSQIQAGNHPGGIPVVGYNAHLSNLGFNGAGVIWAVVDTGVDYDHPDLGPNIAGGYDFPGACSFPGQPGSDCSGGGHGTHVAGIIGGTAAAGFTDANGFLYGLGVAPGYSIFAMNSLSASAWPPTGGWQEHSKRAVLGGAIGGNNSWTTGEGTNHGYQASERTHDIMVLDGNFDTTNVAEPFIEVFSAGNSGPGSNTLTAPKEAKNLIVTASSVNYRAGNINTISSFSSRGPAADGRWVPTIAAPGEQIASSRNDLGGSCSTAIPGTNNLYAFCSGTSMASPHAAGAVVLATEWWRSFNGGANPSAAMAKALLVNTAVDMGTPDIPNINEGWGRVNITNIISPTAMVVYNDETVIFSNTGEQYVLAVGVPDPSQPLKITVAWSDAPGAAGANPALVNNLNLTVENGGNTYLGNVFSGGWSATGGAADNRNNIENVYIQNPGANAIITIDAINISGDAILYNGDPTDQSFALICSNCALFPDFSLSVQPTSLDICTPADATYAVNVGSILGYNDPVTLSASGNPAGTTAVFSVNGQPAPYTSALTIGNTGGATMGSYAINVVGVA
ncbi:MAG: S8 family serine peptidase, partial [Anaerolinea sp.]|nr:S8 family serine peptidase [Anaerolinea sp.]